MRSKTFRVAVRRFDAFEAAIRAQWAAYEAVAATGLELEVVALELHDLEEALFGSGGMARGDWDVCFVATDWIAAMHAAGCAVDLAPLLEREPPVGYPEGWSESLLRLQRIDGAVLGVPYHDGPECLIYRKDVLEGLGLRVPETWEEFHAAARVIQERVPGVYGAVFAGYPDGHNSVYDFLLQLWTRGGELFGPEGAIRFETEAAVAALEFYRGMMGDAGAVHPGCAGFDSVAAGTAFARGEVGMMVNWFGFAAMAEGAMPGRVEVGMIPSAGRPVSLNVYWILSLAAGSVHRDAGWGFLRHTMRPEMDKMTTTMGAIGCRLSTWEDGEVNAAIPFYWRMAGLHAVAREIPRRADWPRIAGVIDQVVVGALAGEAPVRELLRRADAEVSGF